MKKLLILLLMLVGVSAFAQKQKFIIVKTYKNGKATVSKIIPIAVQAPQVAKSVTKAKPQIKIKRIVKTVEIPVDRIVYKESIKYDTVRVPVEKIVEKQVIKQIPFETIVEKIVEKRIEAPITRNVYLGPNVLITNRHAIHGLGLSALIKNKHGELFQISGGMIMRQGLETPAPYINLGAFIKIK
jgi:hypothetical protein